jgi:gliding motility-associated-like protein
MPTPFHSRGPIQAVCLFFLGCLLALASPARATHIVGGEMELVHQTGENYLLILNLYFDAYNGSPNALDADLTASIFQKSNNSRMVNVLLPLTSNTFVNYTNPACAVPTLSTRKLVYSRVITLPATTYTSATGYYIAVERCCRNNTISNIMVPSAAGQAFYLEFPAVMRRGQPFIDSTPRIFPPLADYACRNELFYYDFGGVDADGDSLVYDLVTPLNGHSDSNQPKPPAAASAPYTTINWNPGLGIFNQIPGNPTLRIDRFTGRLTVRPTNIGLFVFGVRCSEYRAGEKIGEARRDFQMMVLNCAINQKPTMVMEPTPPSRTTYLPGRDTLHFFPGSNRCVQLRFTDPNPNSRLTLTLSPVNFSGLLPNFTTATSGSVRAPGEPDTLTATLCFPDCLNSRGGVYLLDVVVGDNGCSLPKRDTVRVAFTAVPPPNSLPVLTTTAGPALPLHVRVGDVVTFDLVGTDPDNDPVTLEMSGLNFSPTALGATLTQASTGNQRRGRFSWRVECPAIDPPLREFVFTAVTLPCNERKTAALTVPIVVDYSNAAPVLTSTLPPPASATDIPLVLLPLGDVYSATLTGTDADRDNLTMTATAENFDLASAGMRFEAQNGTGQARGTFSWNVNCDGVNLHRDLTVTFQLVDATCRPLPQSQKVRFEVISPDTMDVKLYNIITPNGDAFNNEFRLPELPPNFCDAQFANLRIFTRWGQQVYEATNRDFRWKGQGSAGLYFYLVTYTDGRKYRGWLEVMP